MMVNLARAILVITYSFLLIIDIVTSGVILLGGSAPVMTFGDSMGLVLLDAIVLYLVLSGKLALTGMRQ